MSEEKTLDDLMKEMEIDQVPFTILLEMFTKRAWNYIAHLGNLSKKVEEWEHIWERLEKWLSEDPEPFSFEGNYNLVKRILEIMSKLRKDPYGKLKEEQQGVNK